MLSPITPHFEMGAAGENELLVVFFLPPPHVDGGEEDAVLIVTGAPFERRNLSAHAKAHRIRQVLADLAAAVCQAVREGAALAVQQNACRLAGACGEDDSLRARLFPLAALFVDVANAN